MDYIKYSIESFYKVIRNPRIYIPDIFMYVFTYFMTIFFYRSSNLDKLLEQFILVQAIRLDILSEYITTNFFHLIISGLVFIIVTFFIGVGIDVLRFTLIRQVVENNKKSLWETIIKPSGYYLRVVFIKIYVYILTAMMFFISTAIFFTNHQVENTWSGMLLKLLVLFLGIAAIFFIKIAILYRYAVLFLSEEKKAYRSIKRSLKLLLSKPWKVITIWIILTIIDLGILACISGFGIITKGLQTYLSNPIILAILPSIALLLVYLIKLTFDLWSHTLIFSTYKPIKKSS